MTLILYLLGIAAMWVLAWGGVTLANVLGGLAVGLFLLWLTPDKIGRSASVVVRPVAFVRFAAFALSEIVKSNLVLIRAIVARRSQIHTGVMAVPLPECSDELLTIVSNIVAVTPGTSPLHITRHPTVLYVHVLDMRDPAATRTGLQRLADLAYAAFGPDFGGVPTVREPDEEGL